ncbi:AMP-binding protein [Gordonibacter sp. 28C]|uniref:AMP-binding protein n=1 Tax=Gordonibacter sp. 28C TaxID=2078569 RepID=UPI001314B22D|nr:AMP-binding protein [Gordonibacter sp. 28C]
MAFWDLEAAPSSAEALVAAEGPVTYGELAGMADDVAGHVLPGQVVLFAASNAAAAIAGYLGFLRVGAVPLMSNGDAAGETLVGLEEAYAPEFVWAPEGSTALVGKEPVFSLEGYCLAKADSPGCSEANPDLALLLPTSGSTGSSRYVRVSRRNLQSNAEAIAGYMGLSPCDRAITTLPFSYSYGISIVNSHLEAGASVALTGCSLMERGFWDLFRASGATNFGGVPYTYRILEQLRFGRMSLPSLRFATQAGGALGEDMHRRFAKACADKGAGFFAMYGQTEATARISFLPPERALDKAGSVGIAIPGGSLRLEREDASVVDAPGEVGELVYEGPNVTMGYATCRADLSRGDERGGVLRTGDLARFDEDGFFYIEGRKSRFLKVFGNRVGLDDLERLLAEHGVSAACTGEDDCVRVFVENGEAELATELLPLLTGLNHAAFLVAAVEDLPRSESGKVLYSKLGGGR